MDALAVRWKGRRKASHWMTGVRGEREALFHLRKLGDVWVTRRWRSPKLLRGDVDLIAWDASGCALSR